MNRILLINPNTTESMTKACADAIRPILNDQMLLEVITARSGPPSIEGYFDGALASIGLLEAMNKDPNADGYIIGCFDDTGLDAARCIVSAPVIGSGEAAFHIASLLSFRFAVITTLSRSVPVIENNLERYGLKSRCSAVLATDMPVLELECNEAEAEQRIGEQITKAKSLGAEAIVLGCAGMVLMTKRLSEKYGLPVIDGVTGAATIVRGLIDLGLTTSKIGGYASPVSKTYSGSLPSFNFTNE